MAYLRLAMFAGIGVLLALIAMPSTRWAVENDVQFLEGKTISDHFYGCLDPKNWPDKTPEEQLARAVNLENIATNSDSGSVRLKGLESYCRTYPNDVIGWAHLLRMAMKMPLYRLDNPIVKQLTAEDKVRRQRYTDMIELAIANGERLEPNNTYFPFVQIMLLECQGHHAEAQAVLRTASKETDYNDYTIEEAKADIDVAEQGCGYRGAAMEINVWASILFPHLASIRPNFPPVIFDGSGKKIPELQLCAIELLHTVAKRSSSGITVIVAKGAYRRVLAGNLDRKLNPTPEESHAAVIALDRDLKTEEVEKIDKDFDQVDFRRAYPVYSVSSDNNSPEVEAQSVLDRAMLGPLASASLLIGILLAIPAVLLATLASELKLRIMRKAPAEPKPWFWYLSALVVSLSVIGIACSIYWKASGRVFAPENSIETSAREFVGVAIGWLSAALMVGALVLIPRQKAKPQVAIAVLLSVLPVLYMVSVIQTVRLDEATKKVMDGFTTEVQRIRGSW